MTGTYSELMKLNQTKNIVGSKSEKVKAGKAGSPTSKKKRQATVTLEVKQPRHRDTKQPRNQATRQPRQHDTMIERVRKAVKDIGKEAGTHRFTEEEKRSIADIVYSYTRRGVRTSENELTRIAVNFIVRDYEENGENSVLDRVLKALSA